jgi:hypothetical protein
MPPARQLRLARRLLILMMKFRFNAERTSAS